MPCDDVASITMPATPLAVREALRSLFDTFLRGLSPADGGVAQIVLAEALNNVVKHAYRGRKGQIALTIRRAEHELSCHICDSGRAMPGGHLPARADLRPQDLPEGGFGWVLIHTLALDLEYLRSDGKNHLRFRLARTG